MFKKKCKSSGCLFRNGRTHRCSLDKRCFLLCKMQQSEKTLNLRDLRIMCATQTILEKFHRKDIVLERLLMHDELPQILDFMYCSNCPYRFSCNLNPVFCPDIDDMKEKENGSIEK